jgi:hypothetical protein
MTVTLSSSTVTSRLHPSGQSRGQTVETVCDEDGNGEGFMGTGDS